MLPNSNFEINVRCENYILYNFIYNNSNIKKKNDNSKRSCYFWLELRRVYWLRFWLNFKPNPFVAGWFNDWDQLDLTNQMMLRTNFNKLFWNVQKWKCSTGYQNLKWTICWSFGTFLKWLEIITNRTWQQMWPRYVTLTFNMNPTYEPPRRPWTIFLHASK